MNPIFFLRGRTALYFGLKHLKFKSGDKIFVPSLICDAVTDEIRRLKIKPVYYEINKNFDAKWNDIYQKYSKDIKGILMVHFFGKPQNLIKFKKFSKKKNIYLIEDNCHGFNGIKNIKFSGDITIMSPYKIINMINNGGILFIKKNSKKNLLKINSLENHKSAIFDDIKNKIKNFTILKNLYRSFIKRPDYESLSVTKKISVYNDKLLDEKTIKKIQDFSFKTERNLRVKRFKEWEKKIKEFNLTPYFNYTKKDNYILWYLVVKINNYESRKKIYDWGWNNNVDIISWPSFPKQFNKNCKTYRFSRKFVLFPLNKDFKDNVKKFKY